MTNAEAKALKLSGAVTVNYRMGHGQNYMLLATLSSKRFHKKENDYILEVLLLNKVNFLSETRLKFYAKDCSVGWPKQIRQGHRATGTFTDPYSMVQYRIDYAHKNSENNIVGEDLDDTSLLNLRDAIDRAIKIRKIMKANQEGHRELPKKKLGAAYLGDY